MRDSTKDAKITDNDGLTIFRWTGVEWFSLIDAHPGSVGCGANGEHH